MRSLYLFVVILIFVHRSACQLKQEGAKVNVCNPKWFTNCYAMTRRARRGEPYRTTFTAYNKYLMSNNATLKVILDTGMPIEIINVKLCDLQNIKWVWEYIQTYSNVLQECPHKPGVYGFYDLEFPPKNMPQSMKNLMKGKLCAQFVIEATKTGEKVADYSVIFFN